MKPNIGIPEKKLIASTAILSAVLSNEMALYVKTLKGDWNLVGESSIELHLLLGDQIKKLAGFVDEAAECIGKLGQKTIGTMTEFLKLTSILENPGKYIDSKELILELLDDHEMIIIKMREDITTSSTENNDTSTAACLTNMMSHHEKMAFSLRRYLN